MYQDWMEKIPVLDDIEINKCEHCYEDSEGYYMYGKKIEGEKVICVNIVKKKR